jgi:hypothetical protein
MWPVSNLGMNMMKGSTETVDDQIGIGQEKGVM